VKIALARSASNGHCGNIVNPDIATDLAQGDVLLRGFVAGTVANPQWAQGDLQIGGAPHRLEIARVLSADGRTLEYGFQSPRLEGTAFWCFEVSEDPLTDESIVADATQLVTFPGVGPAPGISGVVSTAVSASSARIAATIDPDGTPSSAYVEYGPTSAYGSRTAPSAPASVAGPLSAVLEGLRPATTYHYRVVATSSTGTSSTPDQTVVTRGGARVALAVTGGLVRGSLARCTARGTLRKARFRWLRGGVPIAGATASTHRVTGADAGRLIRCRASYTGADGTAATVTSPGRRARA
jgi:hypothetical protein